MNQLGLIGWIGCASPPFHSGRLDLNWRCDSSLGGDATFWGLFFRVRSRMVCWTMQSDRMLGTFYFRE